MPSNLLLRLCAGWLKEPLTRLPCRLEFGLIAPRRHNVANKLGYASGRGRKSYRRHGGLPYSGKGGARFASAVVFVMANVRLYLVWRAGQQQRSGAVVSVLGS